MITLFIRHKVKDYAAWKRVYDAYDRKGDGCTRATVHRDPDYPNLVVVTESFPDLATARAHASSEKLKAAMGQAGVASQPEFWFSEDVEDVSY
ncbi:MAG: putative quinol monooxygenase [Candidatus Loosdrechtia sp.]|uniref:putative quinol monooxygenase n=1 Tax=Candidatus Loosdrechtia sp. TaxID=3101272 RepID=UPI003A6DFD41|nr:MAG: antibiotic biosynthesis monooxygenase [Candidatus Jettenia sp. AMX2]